MAAQYNENRTPTFESSPFQILAVSATASLYVNIVLGTGALTGAQNVWQSTNPRNMWERNVRYGMCENESDLREEIRRWENQTLENKPVH